MWVCLREDIFFYEKYYEMKKKILWKAMGSTMKWYGGWKLCIVSKKVAQ